MVVEVFGEVQGRTLESDGHSHTFNLRILRVDGTFFLTGVTEHVVEGDRFLEGHFHAINELLDGNLMTSEDLSPITENKHGHLIDIRDLREKIASLI